MGVLIVKKIITRSGNPRTFKPGDELWLGNALRHVRGISLLEFVCTKFKLESSEALNFSPGSGLTAEFLMGNLVPVSVPVPSL
ncbi:MAG: hypothetical protein KC643_30985, partial [Nitrospira sp.]|nr:hypothetical protein [Nitrospira sp.]